MILKTENFNMNDITEEDTKRILEVYNSNQDFLLSHMDRREVSIEWIKQEQDEMKGMNFKTLIVKENGQISLVMVMVNNEWKVVGTRK